MGFAITKGLRWVLGRGSAKPGWCKTGLSEQGYGTYWFMHDAHLGRAFLFLDMLDDYTLLSMTVMVTPCLWYVVGMKLVCPMSKFPQAPFARAPFGESRLRRGSEKWVSRRCLERHLGEYDHLGVNPIITTTS